MSTENIPCITTYGISEDELNHYVMDKTGIEDENDNKKWFIRTTIQHAADTVSNPKAKAHFKTVIDALNADIEPTGPSVDIRDVVESTFFNSVCFVFESLLPAASLSKVIQYYISRNSILAGLHDVYDTHVANLHKLVLDVKERADPLSMMLSDVLSTVERYASTIDC